jgi:hypothetical protein
LSNLSQGLEVNTYMKKYVVRVYDSVALYDIEADSKQEAETKAIELYKKEKDTWLGPRLVETEDEYEVENEPDRA